MRYTVLTYIFGNYEKVHEVREKDPDADYVLVTDDLELTSDTWRIVHDADLRWLTVWEKCYCVRFNPFKYTNSDIIVRLDGSIGINRPLKPLVDEFNQGEYDRCLMIHPTRDNIPDEYQAWIDIREYPEAQARHCMAIMQHLGYDLSRKGLYQGCFEIVRFNRVNTIINTLTHGLLRYAATDGHIERVNQTWLSMVVNHLFDGQLKVMPVTEDILHGELMTWYQHNSDAVNPQQ